MALSDRLKNLLNKMNSSARKAALGTVIQTIENNQLQDLATGSVPVGDGSTAPSAVDLSASEAVLIGNGTSAAAKAPSADGLGVKRCARATYDFDVDGGAAGTIGSGVTLPDNAVITRAWYDVITTCESEGADAGTMAINIPTDGDLNDAIAISDVSNPYDAGIHDIVNAANVAEDSDDPSQYLKLTDARELSFVIAGQDFTAGKLVVFVEYFVSE